MRALFISFLSIFFIVSSRAYSAEYYVDQNFPGSSDANDGTSTRPWKTIQKAASQMVAGDTVNVRNGVYRESIEVKNSGENPQKMIAFRASGNNVIVKGSDVVSGWTPWRGKIWKKDNWPTNSQQVFVDGEILGQIGGNASYPPQRLPARGAGVSDVEAGTFYYNATEKALYVWLKDGGNPNQHLVEASTQPYLFLARKKNFIRLTGFNFQHSNTTATYANGWPAVNMSSDNSIAENNSVSWCDFTGMGGTGNNLKIMNNTSNYNGNSGMGFTGSGIVMEGNTTNYNNYRGFVVDWHSGGVKNVMFVNSRIDGHMAMGNKGPGIWCDIDCTDVTITSSRAISNEGMGIFYEISKSAVIKNNVTAGNSLHGIYISASDNCLVLNNLAYGNMRGIVVHGVPRSYGGKSYSSNNNVVENNIMADNSNADLVMAKPSANASGNVSDYNLFYQSTGPLNLRLDYAGAMTSLAQWQRATGQDQHSVVGNPRFINSSKGNFQLSVGSPAIGSGKSTPVVDDDLNKNKRGNRNDIGPFTIQK
jgi:parallel beta-helix repeat protein